MSLFFGILSGWMTVLLIREGDLWWILWGVITLLMAAMALALPCLYLMTPKGLHIVHTFGLIRRFIPWDSVAGLEVKYDPASRRLPYLFDTFVIYGDVRGPSFFFTEDEMVRTLRARILLERYTGCPAEGTLLNDLRGLRRKKQAKQESKRQNRARQERAARNRKVRKSRKHPRRASNRKKK
jgi:hypothetical protein